MSNPSNWRDPDDQTQELPRPRYYRPPQPQQAQLRSHPPGSPARTLKSADVDFALFFDPQNRAYLALAITGLVGLIAFFMPYFTVSTTTTTTPTFLNIPLVQSSPLPTTGADAANGFGLLWLVLVAVLVVIIVASVIMLDTGLLRSLTPIISSIVFLVCGVVSFIILVISVFRANGDVAHATQMLNLHATTKYQVILGIGPGFWLTLLAAMIIAIISGYRVYKLW